MEFDMAGPYPRHPVSKGTQGASRSRPGGGHGHSKSWSGSSVDDILSPLGMTPRQAEQDDAIPTGSFADAADLPRNEVPQVGWMFIPRRVRYVPAYLFQVDQSVNTAIPLPKDVLSS